MSYGLYIHIPFCIKKCNYCDFISFPYDQAMADQYIQALAREMAIYNEQLDNKHLRTIYIGGGTPTCLNKSQQYNLMESVNRFFTFDKDSEFTLEANPGTLDSDKLQLLKSAGVNRLSMGAQSFSEKHLQRLGRVHSASEIEKAVYAAREAGFNNLNLDLIFALPNQTIEDWQNTINQTLHIKPEHISAYGLKIEEGTPFAKEQDAGTLKPCDEDLELNMYELAIDKLATAGYEQYEISNFAQPGKESKHNLIYWHNEEYLGLGIAAHSFMGGSRWSNKTNLKEYINAMNKGVLAKKEEEAIPPETQAEDAIFLGLRITQGINLHQFRERYNIDLEEKYKNIIKKHINNGLLEIEGGHLKLTRKGLFLSNEVMVDFI